MRIAKLGKHWKWAEESKEKIKGRKNTEGKHWQWTEESKEKMIGNKNASGKRSKEVCENQKGNKNGLKHGRYTKEAQIKRLKAKIDRLEEKE